MTDLALRAWVLRSLVVSVLVCKVQGSPALDANMRLAEGCPCQPGEYRSHCSQPCRRLQGESRLKCPQGTYATTPNQVKCESCPPGKFGDEQGLMRCKDCPPGTYSDQEKRISCNECGTGTFSMEYGSTQCAACLPNTYNIIPGSAHINDCLWCPAGRFSGTGASQCEACAIGTVSNNGGDCTSCQPGRIANEPVADRCVDCASGKYTSSTSSTSCKDCPAGRWIQQTGASHQDQCRLCNAGRSSLPGSTRSAECTECDQGKFSVAGGLCEDCPAGKHSVAATNCVDCSPGTFSTTDGSLECTSCPQGKYRDESQSATEECTDCKAGRYGPLSGAANEAECLPCSAGKQSSATGQVSFSSCQDCAAGRYSKQASDICPICDSGTYSAARSPACLTCPAGRFAQGRGTTECSVCQPGRYRPFDAAATFCLPCPEGTASNETGAMSDTVCKLCGLGRFSALTGADFCSTCVAGTFSDDQGASECKACPVESETPRGALSCCPLNSNTFPVSPAGSLYTPTGKSTTAVYFLESCSADDIASTKLTTKPTIQASSVTNVEDMKERLFLATLERDDTIQECVAANCDSPSHCLVSVESSESEFSAGVGFSVRGHVRIWDDEQARYRTDACPNNAQVFISGSGCAPNTLQLFFLLLTSIVILTVVIGLILEAVERQRHIVYVECNLDLELPAEAAGCLPTPAMLHQTIQYGLNLKESVIPRDRFHAYLVSNPSSNGCLLHVDFAVKATRRGAQATRKALLQTTFAPPSSLTKWRQVKVEQQQPGLVKARGRLPGMDLVEFVEKVALCVCGGVGTKEEKGRAMHELHLTVARELLKKLNTQGMRFFLWLQYVLNLCVAGTLSALAYYQMTTCEAGYPFIFHVIFFFYIGTSGAFSVVMLRCYGGPQAGHFLWAYRNRILLRYIFSCAMLTDTYQDTTFPVIAKRCGFDLWFVSAWLVVLGIGVMQVCMQGVVLLNTIRRYYAARTPEERERLLVEGAFLALRGSDNLVLVYAVRPAVEERLGGSSSWAMKMSEARISFFRFLFEDVEQSALQFVFLLFYEDANMVDKVWVGISAALVPMLSMTLVVQCLPEIRDWLWYRVLPFMPGNRRFPILRVAWLYVFLILYRVVSVFPWISACSPTGDPCKDDQDGLFWKILSCESEELVFMGLKARRDVVREVMETSGFCLAGLAGSVLLAVLVWGIQKLRWVKNSNRWGEFKNYSLERRFASESEPLRPRTDEDDDPWLEFARKLRTMAIQTSARDGIDTSDLQTLLQGIDKQAFKLSRAPLPNRYPCRRVNIGRKLNGRIQLLGTNTTLNSMGDVAKECAGRLCAEASHAQQVAFVRWNTQRLLSFRQFLRSSLAQKALFIKDATGGYAPLRFIHWAQIEGTETSAISSTPVSSGSGSGRESTMFAAMGPRLPKCGSPGGAEEVEQVLARVAKRLNISVDKAEKHVVPFFLSHRWLRTRGPKSFHHPDTEDNLKAKRLVTFAKWFMTLAQTLGLRCEVIFWIDWCCTDQDDLSNMDLAVAALPLYIASCMKVVVWKTMDFERRCWTMVERLLSYSFCQGGLTPYVIDETFATEEDAPVDQLEKTVSNVDLITGGPTPHIAEGATSDEYLERGMYTAEDADEVEDDEEPPPLKDDGGFRIWQVNLGGGKWIDYSEVAQAVLRGARQRNEKKVKLALHGHNYEVDMQRLTQKNLKTGMERPIREQVVGLEDNPRVPEWVTKEAGMTNAPKAESKTEILADRSSRSSGSAGSKPGTGEPAATSGVIKEEFPSARSSTSAETIGRTNTFRLSQTERGSSIASDFVAVSAVVHRRARKLPNPLDFDACQVTRPSDRRRVAQLVDIALTVPALEVFSDRQPVEWGFTEIVEQSLSRREPLPHKWKDPTSEAPRAWLQPVVQPKFDWSLIVESSGNARGKGRLQENTGAIIWVDHSPEDINVEESAATDASPAASPKSKSAVGLSPKDIDALFDDVEVQNERQSPELNESIRALINGLKADLVASAKSGSEAAMEAAVLRTREVELPEKQSVSEMICAKRLHKALATGKEPVMRAALRMARQYGAEHLKIFEEVRQTQQKLYNGELQERLVAQLAEASEQKDLLALVAVYSTASKHGLRDMEAQALKCATSQVDELRRAGDFHGLANLQKSAEDAEWPVFINYCKSQYEEMTLEKAMEKAAAGDHIPELRAIEKRAQETGHTEIAFRAGKTLKEVAGRVGERMGLPAEWDVIMEQIGAPGADVKLLKKTEEKNQELIKRVQKLVDVTFTGFGPAGKMTRTRDRAKEPIAKWLQVMSVVYVQNAENYVNYKAKRAEIAAMMTPDAPVGAVWDVKTGRVTLEGVGKTKGNPVDQNINEYYMWHGTTPKGAQGITDTEFDLKRAGSAYGALFGPGIYFAESCMKADEYTTVDKRGWMPLLLCRVVLGKVNYCDAYEPKKISGQLEHSCRPGGPFQAVLGDREKVRGTFREFIVFDNHQIYPEYIVWYVRRFS